MAEDEDGEEGLPCVDHVPLNEGAMGKNGTNRVVNSVALQQKIKITVTHKSSTNVSFWPHFPLSLNQSLWCIVPSQSKMTININIIYKCFITKCIEFTKPHPLALCQH